VGRLWTRVWGELSGRRIPELLPEPAQAVLRGLAWTGLRARRSTSPHWFTTLADPPREGPVRAEVRERLAALSGVMV
jgi:acetoin utilization protein AcuC